MARAEGLLAPVEALLAGVETLLADAPAEARVARRVDFGAGVEDEVGAAAGFAGVLAALAAVAGFEAGEDAAADDFALVAGFERGVAAGALARGVAAVAAADDDEIAARFVPRPVPDAAAAFVRLDLAGVRLGLAVAEAEADGREFPDAASISSDGAFTGVTDSTARAAALPTPLAASLTRPPTVPAALPAADAAKAAIFDATAATSWAASPAWRVRFATFLPLLDPWATAS